MHKILDEVLDLYIERKTEKLREDCEALQANENACSTCAFYVDCWEESPWDAARAEYDRSRGV